MQFGFFRIPLAAPEPHAEELNRFLRTQRVLSVHRELVQESGSAYWAVCVEYLPVSAGECWRGETLGRQPWTNRRARTA